MSVDNTDDDIDCFDGGFIAVALDVLYSVAVDIVAIKITQSFMTN